MKYNNTTDRDGIIQWCERLTDLGIGTISGDTNLLKDFTARVNAAGSEVYAVILKAAGNWQYDDKNTTDLPRATTNLVSGQELYSTPSDALTIQRVEILDEANNWRELKPITKEMITGQGLDEFMEENAQPTYYELVGDQIQIFPAANYSVNDGLKAYYDRGEVSFTTSDTTKTPGFASIFHKILPIKAAIDWLDVKQPQSPTLVRLLQREAEYTVRLQDFYGKRFKDLPPVIRRKQENFK